MEECSLIVTSGNYAKQESIAESLTLSLQSSYIIWAAVFTAEQRCCISSLHVVYCHNTEWLTEVWPLGSYLTVFQSELDAIGKLAVDLCKRNITNTEVIIYFNSKAAKNVTGNGHGKIQNCSELFWLAMTDMISQGNTVTINWVPWHVNVRANERADELAKKVTTTPFIGVEPDLPLPQCCIVIAVRQRATAAHTSLEHSADRPVYSWPSACPNKNYLAPAGSQQGWNKNGY